MAELQVAIIIDTEDLGLDLVKGLLDNLSNTDRVNIKWARADWSKSSKRDQLLELGIEFIQVSQAVSSGKDASAIQSAVDAIHPIPISERPSDL